MIEWNRGLETVEKGEQIYYGIVCKIRTQRGEKTNRIDDYEIGKMRP
jgi:hypothetical protein